MSSWETSVSANDGQENDGEESAVKSTDTPKLQEITENGNLAEYSKSDLSEMVEGTDDEDLLREVWLGLPETMQDIVESKIEVPTETLENPRESTEEISSGSADSHLSNQNQSSQNSDLGLTGDSDGPPGFSNAMGISEAAEIERRWKIMVWGPEKLFKTHFAYTMPQPIAFLDLEGKANDIAKKFTDIDDIQIWQPKDMEADPDTRFRRAKKALHQAIEWLDWYRENQGRKGTIVVDSMTQMWEWAQFHHKIENYPLKDPENVELSANFSSSQESDWAVIKEYHNGEFRSLITESPYHYYWSCMEREDFNETLDDDKKRTFLEPIGEKTNPYKTDTVIRARNDRDRGKVGDLVGSNYTDNVFVGLEKPTFPKFKEAIEKIEDAESTDDGVSRSELANEIGAETIIDYDPQIYTQ